MQLEKQLLGPEALDKAAECLRVLANPTRLRMLQVLLRGRFTVGEIAEACGVGSALASGHLRLMQRCDLLESEREGRRRYYRVSEPHVGSIMRCIEERFGGGEG